MKDKKSRKRPKTTIFIDLLIRIRNGVFDNKSEADWKFLLERQISPNRIEEFKDAIRLFPDRASCSKYNNENLKQVKMNF